MKLKLLGLNKIGKKVGQIFNAAEKNTAFFWPCNQ